MIESTDGHLATRELIKGNRLAALNTSSVQAGRERDLNHTKWFDYRFISPWEATELFVAEYQKQFRFHYGQNIDTEEAEDKTGTRASNWRSNPRELASFWNARQFADEVGMPYGFFAQSTFAFLMKRGWQHIPRPNQLYGSKNRNFLKREIEAQWVEWQSAVFVYSALQQYHVDNFLGSPAQFAHQDWVIAQIRLQHNSTIRIGRACFVDFVLPVDRAIGEFGAERLEMAREDTKDSCQTMSNAAGPYRTTPSCYGVLHSHSATAQRCKKCRVADGCIIQASDARDFVMKHRGSEDPLAAHRRYLQRERTRKFRARALLAAREVVRVS
jgi:hypothetical protein